MTFPAPVPTKVKTLRESGTRIVICRRPVWSGVMVWSAIMIHPMSGDPGLKATSLSLLAFERLTEADTDLTRNRSELLVWTHTPNGRARQLVGNIEGFEGTRTLLHQLHY